MEVHKAETGERYSDDSGWERRVAIDTQENSLIIEINGSRLSASADDVKWLISALELIGKTVGIQ